MPDKEQKKDELGKDDLEVEPLADEALESVSGGGSSDGCCSCSNCSKEEQQL